MISSVFYVRLMANADELFSLPRLVKHSFRFELIECDYFSICTTGLIKQFLLLCSRSAPWLSNIHH